MCQVTVPLALFVRICGNGSVERVGMVVLLSQFFVKLSQNFLVSHDMMIVL